MDSIIGMEISRSYLKSVEMKPKGKYPELLGFSMIEFDTEEDRSARIRYMLKERGFRSRIVNLAPTGIMPVHRLIDLPPMSKKEMEVVVPREIKYEIADLGEDLSFDYQTVEGGAMVVAAPDQFTRDYLSLVEDAGLKCSVFATIPLALSNLLKLKGGPAFSPSLFVHLGGGNYYIAVCSEDKLFFASAYPLQPGGDRDVERVAARVIESISFFKDRFHQEISGTILSGDADKLDILAEALKQESGTAVEIFNPMGALDITRLGEEAQMFQNLIPSFAVPIGLALKGKKNFQMNLLSTSRGRALAPRWGAPKKVALAAVIFSFFSFMIMTYVFVGLSKAERHYQRKLEMLGSSISKLTSSLGECNEIEKKREVYQTRGEFLQGLEERSILWSKAFEELRALVPDGIAFRSLDIERVKDRWQVSIIGETAASDLLASITACDRFFSALRKSPFFTNVSCQQPLISSPSETKGFEITCGLKWRPLIISEGEQESSLASQR